MVNGLDKFREKFGKFSDGYAIIGGTACSVIMEHEGYAFRSTKDIDAILIVDANNFKDFAKEFWEFIHEGEYKFGWKGDENAHFYRFTEPKNGFPVQIELFSRSEKSLDIPQGIIRVPISEDISSLSAIILDEDYYNLIKKGCETIDGIRVLKPENLILFKMFARVNLEDEKNAGKHVNEKDLKKHKNDVFRLLQLLPEETRVSLPEKIRNHVQRFLGSMQNEPLDEQVLGQMLTKDSAIDLLRDIYLSTD